MRIKCLLFLIAINCLSAETKRALLVGIDTYWTPGMVTIRVPASGINGLSRFDMPNWPNLKGSVNDVNLIKSLLTSEKFGFSTENVRVLAARDATRDGILTAMRTYLVDKPAPGDTVVFYYAGHGSQRFNSKTDKRLNHLDNTIVPSDANTGQFDVRDREIARILNAALDKGVHVTAIFDSCHSGTIARGLPLGSAGMPRFLGYDPRDINEGPDMHAGIPVPRPEDRKGNPALVFTATQADQLAREWEYNGEYHGAFTVALVEARRFLPVDTPARDLYKRVKVVMEGMGLGDQQPVLATTEERKAQPLLGHGSIDRKTRIAVARISEQSTIILDSGMGGRHWGGK